MTPESLAAKRGSATERLIKDVESQIDQLNSSGKTAGRVYFEGSGNFDQVVEHFESRGFKLTAPGGDDNAPVENTSWWFDWSMAGDGPAKGQ